MLSSKRQPEPARGPANSERSDTPKPLRRVDPTQGDARLAVTLTLGELRELVRDVVATTLAESADDKPPALLDRTGLARALGCSIASVDRLRSEGLPTVMLGDSPRFVLDACLSWLRDRGQP